MSQETHAPEPATLAELKQKFPKSTAEWREQQLEAGATLEGAAVAYAQFQEERAATLQKRIDDAESADGKKHGGKAGGRESLGHQPLRERSKPARAAKSDDDMDEDDDEERTEPGCYTGDAVSDFNSAVRRLSGRTPCLERRQNAIRQVIRREPELYRAYLLATNADTRRMERMIAEKLGG